MKRFCILFVIFIALSSLWNVAVAQNVEIPDVDLAAAVREALDLAPDAPITQEAMAELTYLDASFGDITNLTGLEYATNLTELWLRRNDIIDLTPLQNLRELSRLFLDSNAIIDLTPLQNLTNLTLLSLNSNAIIDLTPLQNLRELYWLHLNSNAIIDLTPLQNLRGLYWLSLNSNAIIDLTPLQNLRRLGWLFLDSNPIVDLTPLQNLTNLTDLYLNENFIGNITSLTNLTGLRFLELRNNQITDVSPLVGLVNLKRLKLAGNPFTDTSPLAMLLAQNPELDLDIDPTLPRPAKITGPWLWMMAPTEPGQGGPNSIDIDSLAAASGGTVTEVDVAANGANIGDRVGNLVWTLGEIAATGGNNINDLVNRIGFAEGGVDDHSAYALITLESATHQSDVTMRVGSDDSVKIWLNGEVVYNNPADRGASDFQDAFEVNLVAGDNLLLVKVSDRAYYWSMFVGIDANVTAVYKPPTSGTITFNPSTIADQIFVANTPIAPLYLPLASGGTPPYTYTLEPLPNGLVFDPAVQVLTGMPTTEGTTTLTYTATDAAGASAALTFTIEVIEEGIGTEPLDVNGDGQVTVVDLAIVALFYGTQVPVGVNLPADVNADGVVNLLDLTAVAQAIDAAGGGLNQLSLWEVEAALLAAVDQAADLEGIAGTPMGFGSPRQHSLSGNIAYRNIATALADARLARGIPIGLSELLQLLAEMVSIPEATTLLPNYPNPFNPETWIPYHLAEDAVVSVTIYDASGISVRELLLGHQAAGIYESRGRAVYWDGKNALGEPVSSGLYFYTLTTGDFSATRKLLIVK